MYGHMHTSVYIMAGENTKFTDVKNQDLDVNHVLQIRICNALNQQMIAAGNMYTGTHKCTVIHFFPTVKHLHCLEV